MIPDASTTPDRMTIVDETEKLTSVSLRALYKPADPRYAKFTSGGCKSILAMLYNAFISQDFLDAAEHISGRYVKKNAVDENINMALINSLILTMVFPLGFSNGVDWIEQARKGYLATTFGLPYFESDWEGMWYDIFCTAFWFGTFCLAAAVFTHVCQLLMINELEDDNLVSVFMIGLGRTARRIPFRYLNYGLPFTILFSIALRILFTAQTLILLICYVSLHLLALTTLYALYKNMLALYKTLEEQSKYDLVSIPEQEMSKFAEKYFKDKQDDFDLSDFLGTLTTKSARGYEIPLTFKTKLVARKHFYLLTCAELDLKLGGDMLTRLVFETKVEE
jgi:hypothetical protein